MDKGEESPAWWPWCGENHRFVKGPIEDWKGIKNGIIRIGEENIPFKTWLEELRDER